MSKESLDGKEVSAVFVQVCAEGMAEGMTGQPLGPSEAEFMGMDVPGEEKGINRPVQSALFWEEIPHRFAIGKPVLRKDVKCGMGKESEAVGTVFPMGDVDAHIRPGNVRITERADFTDTQAGRIHEGDHGLRLEVRDGGDEIPGFLLGRDKREVLIKTAERELCMIPRLM